MDQFSFNPFHLITENPALKWHCSMLHLHKMILVIFYHYYQCGVNSIIKMHFVVSQLADNIELAVQLRGDWCRCIYCGMWWCGWLILSDRKAKGSVIQTHSWIPDQLEIQLHCPLTPFTILTRPIPQKDDVRSQHLFLAGEIFIATWFSLLLSNFFCGHSLITVEFLKLHIPSLNIFFVSNFENYF